MKYILVIQESDYFDNFLVFTSAVLPKDEWEVIYADYKRYFEENPEGLLQFFGMNEELEWESFEAWDLDLEIKEITEDEYKTFIKLYGFHIIGTNSAFLDTEYLFDEEE